MPNGKTRKRPIRTIKGRVVYERRVHEFTDKDLLRVVRHIITREPQELWLSWITDFLFIMIRMALEFGLAANRANFVSGMATMIGRVVIRFIQLMVDFVENATDFVVNILVGLLGLKKDE